MAFRATNVIPQIAYQKVRGAAANVKTNCIAFNAQMLASGATYTFLRDVYVFLKNADDQFASLATTPGLPEYAQQQEADEAYNIAAEFTAMRATISTALSWMQSNVPTSVTATAPAAWTQNGPLIATSFTAQQTAGFRTILQAVADSIA